MRLFLVVGLLGAVAAPAWSDALPAPTTSVTCTDVTVITDPSACTNGGASASLTLLPFAGEQVHAFAPASDPGGGVIFGAGATADIQYSFEVVGGAPGDLVPVIFAANLDATGSSLSHANGFASIFVHTSQGDTQVCVESTGFGCPTTPFSGTFTVSAKSGDLGDTVNLEVSAGAGDSLSPETASASADPLIFVDPAFPGADQYSIVLSPGVGNAIPVPEPSTSVSLAMGLLVVALRARRPKAAPATR